MEAVGAVASIAGIASLGLQLAQLLQKQVGEICDAEERVNDLVSEVQATSNNLDKIKSLLPSDDGSTKKPTLNERFHGDLQFLIDRCEAIFRNVVKLLAKAGKMALSSVDRFLRPFKKNETLQPDTKFELEIEFVELSASDKALWSFRRPKIEQYIADLGRLKSELMLLLLIISLAKTGPISTEKDTSLSIPATDDASTLVDEIFYTNQALGDSEKGSNKNSPQAETIYDSEDHDALASDDDVSAYLLRKAATLFLNWPCSSTTDPPTLQLLVEHNIFFEAYVIDMAGTAHEYAKLPVPLRELYEKALEFARSNEKSISDHFAELPFSQQKILEQTLWKIDPTFRNQSPRAPLGMSVVVALDIHHPPRKSTLRRLKAFFGSENSEFRGCCVRITLLRLLKTEEEEEAEKEEEEEGEEEEEEEEKKGQEEEQAEKRAAKQLADATAAAARENAMSETAAATATPTLAPPAEGKEPVQFKDAIGRKFSFPFKFCYTWKGMSELINQAFEHVEEIGPHVQSGHYDLVDPDGQIILPILWDATVQPGWVVQQHMWPLREPKTEPNPPPPPLSDDYILNLDDLLRPDLKEKKPSAKPRPASGLASWMLGATKPKLKSKTKPSPALPLESTSQQLPPDVTRIADYKHKQTKETGSLIDETREGMPPSDDDKKDVARYYLMKWTTEWESAGNKDETKSQDSEIAEVLEDE